MKVLCSELDPDYSRYRYPYVVWAFPEPGETPADVYAAGFHPASPGLDRFTLCRHLRVPLPGFQPSSENRRILRKGAGLRLALVDRAAFAFTPARREAWLAFAAERFGVGVMTGERLDGLMSGAVVTHLLVCLDEGANGAEVGHVLLYAEAPRMVHYYYAFYDRRHPNPNLGLYLMTSAVVMFRDAGVRHLYLGTCYSERALYKTQFAGIEFFNGVVWSSRLEELKYLVRRERGVRPLLEDPAFLEFHGGLGAIRSRGDAGWRVAAGSGTGGGATAGSRPP